MTPPPTSIDGTDITGATIDGTEVKEITVDGDTVFTAGLEIPQTGLLHDWDLRNVSGSDGDPIGTVTDQQGSDDLTQTTSSKQPTLRTGANGINNLQVARHDGSDDLLTTTLASTVTQPIDTFVVFRINTISAGGRVVAGGSRDEQTLSINNLNSGEWAILAGNKVTGGSTDTNAHLGTVGFDGANSEFRLDQSDEVTGDFGTNSLSGFATGSAPDGVGPLAVDIGQIAVYDASVSGYSRADVESYFVSEWGPF